MSYKGEKLLPLSLTAAAQLERNRAVTITDAGVPAYTTYGSVARGVTRVRGNVNDYQIEVLPLDFVDKTFTLGVVGTVAAGALLFPADAVGRVKGLASATPIISRSEGEEATPTEGDLYIVPTGIDWEAGTNQEKIATRGAAAWTYASAAVGDTYYVTDEGCYVTWNGTAWVITKVVAIAAEAGVSGEDVTCYRPAASPADLTNDNLADAIKLGTRIVCAGLSVAESDADASVVISDDRIAVGDIVVASVAAQAGTASIQKAVVTANTITVTLSGNGGAGTIIAYIVCRDFT